ncbi:MAG TPA: hypothetical protein VGY30_03990, partial [Solirubrobacteraceae bacterium]|nr:hypothetical protein [Solirubrobacteraceae bacterium]
CDTFVPARASSTTWRRTSGEYFLGIESSSLSPKDSKTPSPRYRGQINAALAEAQKPRLSDGDELTKLLFTQSTALEELIRAAEGVPRDALQIVSRAGLRAGDSRISTDDVRTAAAQVYQTTKAALINGAPEARRLLEVIIDDVVSDKKARAFLLRQEAADHPLIQLLVDERLLHLIKRGYSHKGEPGTRFDVLQVDYGCYVHMLATASAPQMTLQGLSDDRMMEAFYGNVEVPEDDYRAIRRAELDLQSKLDQIQRSSGDTGVVPSA